MTDNIFDRLMDMLHTSGPVNWRLAREISASVSGPPEPIEPWIAEEYRELTNAAALRVGAASPFDASAVIGDIQAVDRRTWTSLNIEGFSYLAEPLSMKMSAPDSDPFGGLFAQLGPALLGMQVGTMVGTMSRQVLGQFDVGLPASETVAYVVPNIESFAAACDVEVRQARLWVALHEVIHHGAFAVPWVREHLQNLVAAYVEALEFDPTVLQDRLSGVGDPAELEAMLQQPGALTGLVVGPEQEQALGQVEAFMAIIEGYGEHLMDAITQGLIPEAHRLGEALERRREQADEGEAALQQVLGLQMAPDRRAAGATFCEEIARRWGPESLTSLWDGPEMMPSRSELDDVVGWAARVLL